MKMNNVDLVQLTEIKQYLLDPPTSFRLAKYAIEKIDECFLILEKNGLMESEAANYLAELRPKIEQGGLTQGELRNALIKGGRLVGDLNNR